MRKAFALVRALGPRAARAAKGGSARIGAALATLLLPATALAHVVAPGDKGYVMCTEGLRIIPFIYMGAKHMVTGYDHLLFLVGVIFYLYRLREIALYVTLFALGHTITLLTGVLAHVAVNTYLIDAIIGFSVVYKGLDNNGYLSKWLGAQPSIKASTMFFGLCHGMGLASKLQDFELSGDGLVANLVSFNVGVEIGQILALSAILIAMSYWRRSRTFVRYASAANFLLVAAGVVLVAYQLTGFMAAAK